MGTTRWEKAVVSCTTGRKINRHIHREDKMVVHTLLKTHILYYSAIPIFFIHINIETVTVILSEGLFVKVTGNKYPT